ncbi:hypothetical protein L7H23_01120 [Sphingopyxis sp. BSN-002]|uniref:hypothetical protein n=1 Tax=Sphingopyxis sp. BSN-002 TaxID=2911495 RepID=UPI001EDBE435|nr:hypothetical protein [Sphingopyxis sp. BSN-002]QVJ07662.1 radical SAM superfamily protein [Sphingopyxis phage VSN-002]UKK84734.1 hypothetical protein L7H23_01120 [Sphingopyxis sp. BSN-002]
MKIDFTRPATIHALAALPYFGQAEAVIRRIDPFWKVDLSEPVPFKVELSRGCDCDCPHCMYSEDKAVTVYARSEEEAMEIAEEEHGDWEAVRARLGPVPTASVSDSDWEGLAA